MNNIVQQQLEKIKRGAVEIIQSDELAKKIEKSLREKKPLKIKAGFDPSAPDIHLGHTVLLRKLKQFQELGHQVMFLIGDFTGRVGDPSGQNAIRPTLTKKEVLANARTYEKQIYRVLDKRKTKIVFNSSWFDKMKFQDIIQLGSHYTVSRILERDDFTNRLKQGKPISMLEFLYPLFQGYDSVMMEADVELGGTDQKFNLLVGRDLQREYNQDPQVVITMPLLEGTDGVNKMSKSLNNYIGITEEPNEMFGKCMSVSDSIMWRYFELLTDVELSKIDEWKRQAEEGKINPRDLKEELGKNIVAEYYGKGKADTAAKEFRKIFAEKSQPTDIPALTIPAKEIKDNKISVQRLVVLTGVAKSNAEAKRLIEQGGVNLEPIGKITDFKAQVELKPGAILKIGKRNFFKL